MCSLAATKPLLWKTVVNERQPSLSIPAGVGGGGGGGGLPYEMDGDARRLA